MIKTHSYHSENEGPHLLVTGAVHGNELCGPEGIKRVMAKLQKIERGSVTFIPVCNPLAHEKNVRFIDTNLNRSFSTQDTSGNENKLKLVLRPYLERADYLMDIHSYTAGPDQFICAGDKSEDEWAFIQASSIAKYISGFQRGRQSEEERQLAKGTTEYAREHGTIAFTLECGQHKDPASIDAAERTIWQIMDFLGIVKDGPFKADTTQKSRAVYDIQHTEYRTREGRFLQPWRQFQYVEAGTEMAEYEDGEIIKAAISGYLIMPNEKVPLNGEWFFISELIEDEKRKAA
ncbi:MAG: hypothetical protein GC136_09955 [Alphaproteobacteria bacterium]|nr:hypothetical protein [Alphaproteobacteria bacterium]